MSAAAAPQADAGGVSALDAGPWQLFLRLVFCCPREWL